MGRFVTTNAPAGASKCTLGNSTATVCGSFCGDGRNICNVGACSSSGIGCVWQPIEVCCCWNNQVNGYKCFLYNFSCWHMIKFEAHGMARCEYDSQVKVLADSTNCDLISNPNTNVYAHRYQMCCGFACASSYDIFCIPTQTMSTAGCMARTSVIFCLYPVVHGCLYNSHIGGRYEVNNSAGAENSCSIGSWNPVCNASPGQICYPLCCVVNCIGMNFNRLRIANTCCFWSSTQGPGRTTAVDGAYYGLWGIPRQTVALAPSV